MIKRPFPLDRAVQEHDTAVRAWVFARLDHMGVSIRSYHEAEQLIRRPYRLLVPYCRAVRKGFLHVAREGFLSFAWALASTDFVKM